MKKGDNIFVYGTLREGKGADYMMKGNTEPLGVTRICATMFSLGGFPGIKVASEDFVTEGPKVEGELHLITDENLSSRLDSYEGYPNLYTRRVVETELGPRTWVYEYNGEPGAERLIPSGVWE